MTNTPPRKLRSALEQLSSSFYGLPLSALPTFSSWATRRGSYLIDLSEDLLQSLGRTPYSPRSSKCWISFRHLRLGQPDGVRTIRPGAAGLLADIECSRVRDSSWMYLTSFVTTRIGIELATVQRKLLDSCSSVEHDFRGGVLVVWAKAKQSIMEEINFYLYLSKLQYL